MVSGAGTKCVKYLLFIFNFLFLLAGLALIIVGAIAQLQQSSIQHVNSAAVLIIVIGCVVFFLSFFGCCGAVKENQCMLMTFGILMIIVFVLCVAAIIVTFALKSQIKELWKKPLKESLESYKPGQKVNVVYWPELQLNEKCCGVDNASDWRDNKNINPNPTDDNVPASCCDIRNETAICLRKEATHPDNGCFNAIVKTVEDKIVIVAGVVVAVAILELLGIVFAFVLANAIHKGYNVV